MLDMAINYWQYFLWINGVSNTSSIGLKGESYVLRFSPDNERAVIITESSNAYYFNNAGYLQMILFPLPRR